MSLGVHQAILKLTSISNSTGIFTSDGAMFAAKRTRGGFTPLIRAENVYVAYYSSDEARSVREWCCCPAILIGSTGPNLLVSGAVFADQLIVQNLGDSISIVPRPNLNGRSMLDDAGHRVAQLFYALRTCLKELDDYYTRLIESMTVPDPHPGAVGIGPRLPTRGPSAGAARTMQSAPMISPYFKTYENEQGKTVPLTYKRRLAMEYPMKAVFVAEAQTDTETWDVVVKFTPTYGKVAHELLARASPPQAPTLRFCEFVQSVGMWVVVMDYVVGKEATGVLQDPAHIASLESAITALHGNGFVFGDLRRPNVLLVGDRVVLIDFDWCGEDGKARYPSDILLEDAAKVWHSSVERGGLIKKVHDRYHFRALTGKTLPSQ
ncbi:hypothetical protein L226DRAFT_572275 [Lentinus tigrinus ALCF2SS1-7]|uniref:uncharacterized protein n=1 Tax=Lentinus tigrinus ALCF2SS1-7 TaxID=1328758 RepID=UPI001166362C|nr:hypothetical protein L226DRAFT_572275 [Lentinus tigrinus ALCF2SS1-7]